MENNITMLTILNCRRRHVKISSRQTAGYTGLKNVIYNVLIVKFETKN